MDNKKKKKKNPIWCIPSCRHAEIITQSRWKAEDWNMILFSMIWQETAVQATRHECRNLQAVTMWPHIIKLVSRLNPRQQPREKRHKPVWTMARCNTLYAFWQNVFRRGAGQHGKSGSPQTEHREVENAARTLRNRRRNKALTARQSESGAEIDLEGSAACDRLRFTGTVETVSKTKDFPHQPGPENDDESVSAHGCCARWNLSQIYWTDFTRPSGNRP